MPNKDNSFIETGTKTGAAPPRQMVNDTKTVQAPRVPLGKTATPSAPPPTATTAEPPKPSPSHKT